MTMFDFLLEVKEMYQEIEEENEAHEQAQARIEQMRSRYGR